MPAPRSNSRTPDETPEPVALDAAPAPAPEPVREKAPEKPKPSSGTAYLNTSGGPLVYDKAGHQVAAGEWTPEVNLDGIGQAARRAGHLKPRSAL